MNVSTDLASHITAVYDTAAAHHLYEQVIGIAAQELNLRVHLRPGFWLCSPAEMARLQQQLSHPNRRTKGQLLGAYIKIRHRREIVVERGLPCLVMLKVIAHEYGHAWQGENCLFLQDPQILEGFCEWVSYRVLGAVGATAMQLCQRQQHNFYGDALRYFLHWEADAGVATILNLVRRPMATPTQSVQ